MAETRNAEQDLIQAALADAFAVPEHEEELAPVAEVNGLGEVANSAMEREAAASQEPVETSAESASDEAWKAEYEAQVAAWREQSAEAREKAEKERERWEAIRAAEKEEAVNKKAVDSTSESQHTESEWEGVASSSTTTPVIVGSPSPIDVKDLVTGEHEKQAPLAPSHNDLPVGISRTVSQPDTNDGSQKWEEVHSSITSSFPSITYPEPTESPLSRQPTASAPLNTTLAIFDSSLSTRTRVTAFFSSLAINMLLPFVNGVMLGFGEIFAKNFIMQWIGWKPSGPGSTAATTGIGISSRR